MTLLEKDADAGKAEGGGGYGADRGWNIETDG